MTRHTPLPWDDGAGAYLHDMAHHLAEAGFTVSILWLEPHDHLRWRKYWKLPGAFSNRVRLRLPAALNLGHRRFLFPAVLWQPFRARVLGLARRLLKLVAIDPPRRHPAPSTSPGDRPRPWASTPTPTELRWVASAARSQKPDIVIASYAWLCPLFALPVHRHAHHACLAHDVGWKRAALAASGAPPTISRADERTWLRHADLVIAISSADAAELAVLAPHAKVILAPKAISLAPPSVEASTAPLELLFVGGDNAFNAEGLTWFLTECWPLIVAAVPGVTLQVCGTVQRAIADRPGRVHFHGMVPTLDARYAGAALVIVPLRRATGLNIKLVDAAAAGRAIVTTSPPLEGAPFLRSCVAVADTSAAFATEVCRLLADPTARRALAARALAAVRAQLSPTECYTPLVTALRRLR